MGTKTKTGLDFLPPVPADGGVAGFDPLAAMELGDPLTGGPTGGPAIDPFNLPPAVKSLLLKLSQTDDPGAASAIVSDLTENHNVPAGTVKAVADGKDGLIKDVMSVVKGDAWHDVKLDDEGGIRSEFRADKESVGWNGRGAGVNADWSDGIDADGRAAWETSKGGRHDLKADVRQDGGITTGEASYAGETAKGGTHNANANFVQTKDATKARGAYHGETAKGGTHDVHADFVQTKDGTRATGHYVGETAKGTTTDVHGEYTDKDGTKRAELCADVETAGGGTHHLSGDLTQTKEGTTGNLAYDNVSRKGATNAATVTYADDAKGTRVEGTYDRTSPKGTQHAVAASYEEAKDEKGEVTRTQAEGEYALTTAKGKVHTVDGSYTADDKKGTRYEAGYGTVSDKGVDHDIRGYHNSTEDADRTGVDYTRTVEDGHSQNVGAYYDKSDKKGETTEVHTNIEKDGHTHHGSLAHNDHDGTQTLTSTYAHETGDDHKERYSLIGQTGAAGDGVKATTEVVRGDDTYTGSVGALKKDGTTTATGTYKKVTHGKKGKKGKRAIEASQSVETNLYGGDTQGADAAVELVKGTRTQTIKGGYKKTKDGKHKAGTSYVNKVGEDEQQSYKADGSWGDGSGEASFDTEHIQDGLVRTTSTEVRGDKDGQSAAFTFRKAKQKKKKQKKGKEADKTAEDAPASNPDAGTTIGLTADRKGDKGTGGSVLVENTAESGEMHRAKASYHNKDKKHAAALELAHKKGANEQMLKLAAQGGAEGVGASLEGRIKNKDATWKTKAEGSLTDDAQSVDASLSREGKKNTVALAGDVSNETTDDGTVLDANGSAALTFKGKNAKSTKDDVTLNVGGSYNSTTTDAATTNTVGGTFGLKTPKSAFNLGVQNKTVNPFAANPITGTLTNPAFGTAQNKGLGTTAPNPLLPGSSTSFSSSFTQNFDNKNRKLSFGATGGATLPTGNDPLQWNGGLNAKYSKGKGANLVSHNFDLQAGTGTGADIRDNIGIPDTMPVTGNGMFGSFESQSKWGENTSMNTALKYGKVGDLNMGSAKFDFTKTEGKKDLIDIDIFGAMAEKDGKFATMLDASMDLALDKGWNIGAGGNFQLRPTDDGYHQLYNIWGSVGAEWSEGKTITLKTGVVGGTGKELLIVPELTMQINKDIDLSAIAAFNGKGANAAGAKANFLGGAFSVMAGVGDMNMLSNPYGNNSSIPFAGNSGMDLANPNGGNNAFFGVGMDLLKLPALFKK